TGNLTAGRVGIGITNPTEKLEVAGTVKATRFEGDGSGLTGISAGGGTKWSDGDSNRIYYNAGNVGIGTNNPTEKLEVAGTVKATRFEGDGSGLTGISAGKWSDGGSNRIYYNAGNVGIGTNNPSQKLDVAGTIRATATNTGNTTVVGVHSLISGNENGTRYALYGQATGNNAGKQYGVYGNASGGQTQYGVYGNASGGQTQYGGYFTATNTGNTTAFGVRGIVSGNENGTKYGLHAQAIGGTSGSRFGVYGNASGGQTSYGGYFTANNTGNTTALGVQGLASGNGNGTKYGLYGLATGGTSGRRFGVHGSH
ncbi:hypothetical protein, partial [Moorena sp. SIO2C4]|uniref:hypothetical protein n=1 Tax=Moorena sp. SIO2C4 TaxID=2607824 RepID=UPI0013CA486E